MKRDIWMAGHEKGRKQGIAHLIPILQPLVSFLFHDLPSLHHSPFQEKMFPLYAKWFQYPLRIWIFQPPTKKQCICMATGPIPLFFPWRMLVSFPFLMHLCAYNIVKKLLTSRMHRFCLRHDDVNATRTAHALSVLTPHYEHVRIFPLRLQP